MLLLPVVVVFFFFFFSLVYKHNIIIIVIIVYIIRDITSSPGARVQQWSRIMRYNDVSQRSIVCK